MIHLQPTCMVLPKGHCLRVSISASAYPAYPVNPGTGDRPEAARRIDQRVITVAVISQGETRSHLRFSTH
jgi:uncharacterized protein